MPSTLRPLLPSCSPLSRTPLRHPHTYPPPSPHIHALFPTTTTTPYSPTSPLAQHPLPLTPPTRMPPAQSPAHPSCSPPPPAASPQACLPAACARHGRDDVTPCFSPVVVCHCSSKICIHPHPFGLFGFWGSRALGFRLFGGFSETKGIPCSSSQDPALKIPNQILNPILHPDSEPQPKS